MSKLYLHQETSKNLPESVAKLLRGTGLDRSLTICPDLRGALTVEQHEPANPSPRVLAG
jgi:hypothetical protein